MYSGQERTELTDEVMDAIQKMDSIELGKFFDMLYLRLNSDFREYCLTLDHATYLLEKNMTDKEIEAQDQKMRDSKPGIRRPRSAHEMTEYEMHEKLHDGSYWHQLDEKE